MSDIPARKEIALVYLSHGVTGRWTPDTIRFALLHPQDSFVRHLRDRETPYTSIAESLAGLGDAFTVDDATYAGFHAAMLARSHGHKVSWYVNGFHVEHQMPYFPFQLSAMLDRTHRLQCTFRGETWCLARNACKRKLRGALKREYMQYRHNWQVANLVGEVSAMLQIDPFSAESDFRTVTQDEVRQAIAAGVDVQNHGWSHLNPLALTAEERTAELLLNEEWLSQFREPEFHAYAPPYGANASLHTLLPDAVLLAHRALSGGWREGNIVNRRELELPAMYGVGASYAMQYGGEAMVGNA